VLEGGEGILRGLGFNVGACHARWPVCHDLKKTVKEPLSVKGCKGGGFLLIGEGAALSIGFLEPEGEVLGGLRG